MYTRFDASITGDVIERKVTSKLGPRRRIEACLIKSIVLRTVPRYPNLSINLFHLKVLCGVVGNGQHSAMKHVMLEVK